jgi:hypothetical protein
MDSLQVAARFAAFARYLNTETSRPRSPEDAGRYSRDNWKRFVPFVQEDLDLGRFLSAGKPTSTRRHRSALANNRAKRKLAV